MVIYITLGILVGWYLLIQFLEPSESDILEKIIKKYKEKGEIPPIFK